LNAVKPARAMCKLPSRKHPFRLPEEVYKTHRSPIFVTIVAKSGGSVLVPDLAPMIVRVLHERTVRFKLSLHAYCIMPDHIHVVCSMHSEQSSFGSFVATFKSEVSRQAHGLGHADFAWQRSYWDRHAREEEDVPAMVEYVLDNPVREGLCERWEDWPWSALLSCP